MKSATTGNRATRSAFVIALVFTAIACSAGSDHPPPASGGTLSSSGGSVSGGGSASEAGADGGGADGGDAGAGACTAATQQGTPVSEMVIAGTPPPPLGGVIPPGTYTLAELDAYGTLPVNDGGTSGGLTGVVGRATLVVTATTLTFTGSRGTSSAPLPSDTVHASTFTITDTTVNTTSICPTAGTITSMPFSAVGGGVAFFVGTQHREVYMRE